MRFPLLLVVIFVCACSRKPAASGKSSETNLQRFERQLLNPAPATVTDVRYDEDLFGDSAYFLAFRCSAADADRIITERKPPTTPAIMAKIRYIVPMSLWLVE